MQTLNLGILAHVDAGKTSLTERLLFDNGATRALGSVDRGTTQTDTLDLERQRGITIRTAVASFTVAGTIINIIDTPGHPDFIAEVERSLSVLDGAILVVSAVEGVQAQTHILMRALTRLAIPTLVFINKTDRAGADPDRVRADIRTKLHADAPVYAGSAITGAGVAELTAAIVDRLPRAAVDPHAPLSGRVFKIERDPAGHKIAYARLFAGAIHPRDRVPFGAGYAARVTAVQTVGTIVKLSGLAEVQVGDALGQATGPATRQFAPPTLESVVVPQHPSDSGALHVALSLLAEQDPLINLRQDDVRGEISVSLYGEVQKEVIADTLASSYGLAVNFQPSTTICVERPAGTGTALESGQRGDPFLATVGLRVEPAPIGSGLRYQCDPSVAGTMPAAFFKAVEDTVHQTLQQGLSGWQVTDCLVTLTHTGYLPRQSHAHARFDKSMSSTGADFRGLTPLVLMDALKQARTVVCEPLHHFRLDAPADTLAHLLPVLAGLRAVVSTTMPQGDSCVLEGEIPAAQVHQLQQRLPGLSRGQA
ncbi:MAG TPA: translation factor GTPase family protein, partial [Candidatus Saccharimonas sp.]|nr:translation factor GTPase family protein [Candidatus Saccharimonas sp.]